MDHACLTIFMCNPLDWYFLVLTVFGLATLLMLISRLPLVDRARSRENILAVLLGLLYFMLYTTVRLRGHMGYFVGMMILDALLLVGHSFDTEPDMQTVGNCRLSYVCGMSVMTLVSYAHL
jgi:hypothetical protein